MGFMIKLVRLISTDLALGLVSIFLNFSEI